jgi:hypothetical protein
MINVSFHLKRMARIQPYKKAVICPAGRDQSGRLAYTHLTFQQLDQESDCIAHGLKNAGISRGVRTILMVKPGLTFFFGDIRPSLKPAPFRLSLIPAWGSNECSVFPRKRTNGFHRYSKGPFAPNRLSEIFLNGKDMGNGRQASGSGEG